jgi:uncharacterized membrane protein HdeD (DUF308 family)
MFELLTRKWWAVALRGLTALLFGLATIAWPNVTLAILVLLYGVFAITDGSLALIGLFDRAPSRRRWVLALNGVLSLLAGVLSFVRPELIGLTWIAIVASWAIATGGLTIIAAFELRREMQGEWLLGLSGVASLLFGVGLALYPTAGAVLLLSLIAAYAVTVGLMLIALGLRLRSLGLARKQMMARTQPPVL